MNNGWNYECECFATPCLRNPYYVSSLQSNWPWLTLNWSGRLKFWGRLELVNQVFREIWLIKSLDWPWNVIATGRNMILEHKLFVFFLCSRLRDFVRLNIEMTLVYKKKITYNIEILFDGFMLLEALLLTVLAIACTASITDSRRAMIIWCTVWILPTHSIWRSVSSCTIMRLTLIVIVPILIPVTPVLKIVRSLSVSISCPKPSLSTCKTSTSVVAIAGRCYIAPLRSRSFPAIFAATISWSWVAWSWWSAVCWGFLPWNRCGYCGALLERLGYLIHFWFFKKSLCLTRF